MKGNAMKFIYYGRNTMGSPNGRFYYFGRIGPVRCLWIGPLYLSWKR